MLMTYIFDALMDALFASPCRLETVAIWHTMVLSVFGRCRYLCVLVTWLPFGSHLSLGFFGDPKLPFGGNGVFYGGEDAHSMRNNTYHTTRSCFQG